MVAFVFLTLGGFPCNNPRALQGGNPMNWNNLSGRPWRNHRRAMETAAQMRRGMGGKPYAYWACSLTGVDEVSKLLIRSVAEKVRQLLADGGSDLRICMPFETTVADVWQNDPIGLLCFDLEMLSRARAMIVHLDPQHPSYGVGSELQVALQRGTLIVPWCLGSVERISPFTRGQLMCAGVKQLPEPSKGVEDAAANIVRELSGKLRLG
jgi:hypothetical protein